MATTTDSGSPVGDPPSDGPKTHFEPYATPPARPRRALQSLAGESDSPRPAVRNRDHIVILSNLGFSQETINVVTPDEAQVIAQVVDQGRADCKALKGAQRFGKIAGVIAVVLGLWLGIYWVADGLGDRRMNSELVSAKSGANQLCGVLVGTSNALAQANAKLPELNVEISRLTATNATLEAKILEAKGAAESALADAERAERERDEAVTKANGAVEAARPILAKAEADAKLAIDAAKTEAAKIVTEAKAQATAEVTKITTEAKAEAEAKVAKAVAEAQATARTSVSATVAPETRAGGRPVIHFATGQPDGKYDRQGPAHPYKDALEFYAKAMRADAKDQPSKRDVFNAMAEALEAAVAGERPLTPEHRNALESARDNYKSRGKARDAENISAALASN